MARYTRTLTVTFVLPYCTVTTTVVEPDIDDWGHIVAQAAAALHDEYGFADLAALADDITVTNSDGDQIEEN